MCEKASAESRTGDFVVGRVVEIGDIEALGNKPGLVIETTMEQLRAHGRNLAFCEVEIRLKGQQQLSGPSAAPADGYSGGVGSAS
jgi:hypothetical protein